MNEVKRKLSLRSLLRFRLRTLLIVVTLFCVACYWVMRPTYVAQRYVAACEAGDYGVLNTSLANAHARDVEVQLAPISWRELLSGRRMIWLTGHGDSGALAGGWKITLWATASGIEETYLLSS